MFFICVFPSEFLYIFKDVLKFSQHAVFSTNLLQVVNFSANFALYCIVDPYFIKTMKHWLLCCFRKNQGSSSCHARHSGDDVTRFTEL